VLGADTRSTSGSTVADKNCEKIHFIAPNIYCCGAGTAADTENVTGGCCGARPAAGARCRAWRGRRVGARGRAPTHPACPPSATRSHGVVGAGAAQIRHRPASARVHRHDHAEVTLIQVSGDGGRGSAAARPRLPSSVTQPGGPSGSSGAALAGVPAAALPPPPPRAHVRRYQGHVSAALVLGGVDLNGPHLLTVRGGGGPAARAGRGRRGGRRGGRPRPAAPPRRRPPPAPPARPAPPDLLPPPPPPLPPRRSSRTAPPTSCHTPPWAPGP
jgi:hypothetical protein